MKHIKFYLKYYKYYYGLEIAYTPDWIFDSKRQDRLKFNYNNPEVFHNDRDKEYGYVCLISSKEGEKYYKKMSMMSQKEKRQFVADYLSGE